MVYAFTFPRDTSTIHLPLPREEDHQDNDDGNHTDTGGTWFDLVFFFFSLLLSCTYPLPTKKAHIRSASVRMLFAKENSPKGSKFMIDFVEPFTTDA